MRFVSSSSAPILSVYDSTVEEIQQSPERMRAAWSSATHRMHEPLTAVETCLAADRKWRWVRWIILILVPLFALVYLAIASITQSVLLQLVLVLVLAIGFAVIPVALASWCDPPKGVREAVHRYIEDWRRLEKLFRDEGVAIDVHLSIVDWQSQSAHVMQRRAAMLLSMEKVIASYRRDAYPLEVDMSDNHDLRAALVKKKELLNELREVYDTLFAFGLVSGGYKPYFDLARAATA